MRAAMERLAGFLARRRWLVLGAWVVVLVASLPLAAKQTENLTGGGFSVPGSQSAEVEKALESDYDDARDGAITVMLEPSGAVGAADAEAAVARMETAVGEVPDLIVAPRAGDEAERAVAAGEVAAVPLRTKLPVDEQSDAAADLREAIDPGAEADGVTPYLAGQPAAWAGLQELSKEEPEAAPEPGPVPVRAPG